MFGPAAAGGQAELMLVPFADVACQRLPRGISDEAAIFAADTLPTGYAAVRPSLTPGDVIVVIGGGPVGLMAASAALVLGAGAVVISEPDQGRRDVGTSLGALAVEPDHAAAVTRELTDGHGAPLVVVAVGSSAALDAALSVVAGGGTVAFPAIPAERTWECPIQAMFDAEVTLRTVIGEPMRWWPEILPLLLSGAIDPTVLITHRVRPFEAPDAYRAFRERRAMKAVIEFGG